MSHQVRVIFHIDGQYVRVLRIRRGQRRLLTARRIREAAVTDETLDLG
jgi:hypothetical protein